MSVMRSRRRRAGRPGVSVGLRTVRPAGLLALLLLALSPGSAPATDSALPFDFQLHPETYSGAGGGRQRGERAHLRHYPVIMIADLGRGRGDWTGANRGNLPPGAPGSVYRHLRRGGLRPISLWMVDFARRGEQMSSIAEAKPQLKWFIISVMRYTGADRVQILAHGAGCVLARMTILTYRIAHWIAAEAYIAGPFHGLSSPPPAGRALRGYPNSWYLHPGSTFLRDLLAPGETPRFSVPHFRSGAAFSMPCLTIRSGLRGGDREFSANPDSPYLSGARNVTLPGLDHDGLRTSGASAAYYVPFLRRKARPYRRSEDLDGDGFRGARFGGPDCDDTDRRVHPAAREIMGDGIDQDCNGADLAVLRGRDGELPLGTAREKSRAPSPGGADPRMLVLLGLLVVSGAAWSLYRQARRRRGAARTAAP